MLTETDLWLSASSPFLLGVQSLVEQHLEVGLVPQPLLGGQRSGSDEISFRQANCYGW